MELKDFIKNVISDISNAVSESQQELSNGTIIAPLNNRVSECVATKHGLFQVSKIDFEVSVTTENKEGNNKGISIASAFIGGKYNNEEGKLDQNISNIRFSIPIIFPYVDVLEVLDKS